MTREEAKDVFLNRGYVKVNGGEIFDGDKWRQSIIVISEWLKEQEPCDKQKYIVKGINNDKIEFVDKYSVRAFTRYIKFIKDSCKYETKILEQEPVLDKIRDEIEQNIGDNPYKNDGIYCSLQIIDKYKAESEER